VKSITGWIRTITLTVDSLFLESRSIEGTGGTGFGYVPCPNSSPK
jgi:hypothetical protein